MAAPVINIDRNILARKSLKKKYFIIENALYFVMITCFSNDHFITKYQFSLIKIVKCYYHIKLVTGCL